MKHQVCVVSGTRADYGPLRPLLIRLRDCPEIELTIAATGSHLSAAFGGTGEELTRDGFAYDSVPFPLDDDSKAGMTRATGAPLPTISPPAVPIFWWCWGIVMRSSPQPSPRTFPVSPSRIFPAAM